MPEAILSILGKYYVQQDWVRCRKENQEENRPQRIRNSVIVKPDTPMKTGCMIGDHFYENDGTNLTGRNFRMY